MSAGEEDAGIEIDEAALDHVVEQQSRRRMPENERLQLQQIESLEAEELEEEEADSEDAPIHRLRRNEGSGGTGLSAEGTRTDPGFTYDTSLASRHAYLGDVDDTGHGRAFLEEGSVVRLPILYLEGTVLFPEATLPLRVIRRRCKAAVQRAISQDHAKYTLAVLHIGRKRIDDSLVPALIGTTAEIRQFRHLPDGSINVVARGRQRFRVQDAWSDDSDTPCCDVTILEEKASMPIPRDAFSLTAANPSRESGKVPRATFETPDANESDDEPPGEDAQERNFTLREQVARFLSGHGTLAHLLFHLHDNRSDDDDDDDDDIMLPVWLRRRNTTRESERPASQLPIETGETSGGGQVERGTKVGGDWGGACKAWARDESKWMFTAQRGYWPHWVYRMYDAYDLSRRAADMWRQMVELPCMDELVGNPGLLSFFIASKMPLPDETRQELLELDVVYRLKREIQLLESMDRIRCKTCRATIARRSDMLVMSTDGPVNAFVNEHGYVHETLTLRRAHGLNLRGRPQTEHSWFPGYAWTIANCVCDTHMGWRFTAMKSDMNPKAFWGIRRSQIATIQ